MTIADQSAGYTRLIVEDPFGGVGYRIAFHDNVLNERDISRQWFRTVEDAKWFIEEMDRINKEIDRKGEKR